VLTVDEADQLASPAANASDAPAERRASAAQLLASRALDARKTLLRLAGGLLHLAGSLLAGLLGLVGSGGGGLGGGGSGAALDGDARLAQGESGHDTGRQCVVKRV
jgi:hypothetical protein